MLNRQSDETSSPYFPQLIISSGFNDIPEIAFGDHGHLRRNASFNQQFDDQEEEDDGQIDYVNVSAAGYHNIHMAIQPSDEPDGFLVDLAAEVKSAVRAVPVFTIGGSPSR